MIQYKKGLAIFANISQNGAYTMFTAIEQEKNYQAIINQIKTAIIQGELPLGTQLPPERELVQMLGVSRSSIREALKALEVQGIVESRQGGGYFVVNHILESMNNSLSLFFMLQGCTVEDLIQLRMTLEFGALRMVIQNSTDEEIAGLGEHLQRYVGSETMEDREKHDLAFHTELVKMSHNPLFVYLLNAMMFMYEQNVNYSNQVVEDKDMMEETIDIHIRLYDAIRARDYTRAERVLTEHFDFTKDDLDRQTVYFFPQEQTE